LSAINTDLHPFDVPGMRFAQIEDFVPDSGIVSGSIRNSLLRERKLRSRDMNDAENRKRRTDRTYYGPSMRLLRDLAYYADAQDDHEMVYVRFPVRSKLEDSLELIRRARKRRKAVAPTPKPSVASVPADMKRHSDRSSPYAGIERLMTERYGVPVS
jgi:hypothetical protein